MKPHCLDKPTPATGFAAFLFSLAVCASGQANAQAAKCPDNGARPASCTKEIRIWNNTDSTIYPVLQGVIQKTDALNCSLSAKGGGDVWLQRALGDTSKCYAVENGYYVYVNPTTGIPKQHFASINVPWWSKRLPGAPDTYVDWWRGARVYIFDDQTALNDSYNVLKKTAQVKWAAGSPVPSCKTMTGNDCLPAQLQIFQVTEAGDIATKSPFQLNEFTFASVDKVTGGGTGGGAFRNFNQNYNVSNVDQIYLPLAIEPIRTPADIGYMGTTMTATPFRKALETFTGADKSQTNPPYWPIYNNPVRHGAPVYPKAGIRVPSAQTVFNFYQNPFFFPPEPEIIPLSPPQNIAAMLKQWTNCTKGTGTCPDSAVYKEINSTFLKSYAYFINPVNKCIIPPFLLPVKGTNPPMPKLTAFLTKVYGWVPFNEGCSAPELPITDNSRVPIDYIEVQYNYLQAALPQTQWFNPYTKLVHATLGANAYAFSIDDQSSFQSNSGTGLILAIGGATGLPNKTQIPPPVPPFYPKFDFSVNLGPPAPGGAQWAKYGICSTVASKKFPGSANGAYGFGVDPAVEKISNTKPCMITLTDTKNRTYRFTVLKAGVPPAPIWPPFKPSAGNNFDPKVMSCPASTGIVPPAAWCNFTNEVADPTENPPKYSISTRGPLK